MQTQLALMEEETGLRGTALSVVMVKAQELIAGAKAENTKRGYCSDWREFTKWCDEEGLTPLPAAPDTVVLYLTEKSDTLKPATLQHHVAAISVAHQSAGHPSPTSHVAVRTLMQGIRRAKGVAPVTKAPAVTEDIRRMVSTLPAGALGVRDRAMLLLGFAGAFRRSEIVGLDREDIEVNHEGLVVTLRRSKTDQEGRGRRIGIPYGSNPATCPVRGLLAWLEVSGITSGPLFRSVNRHGQIQEGRLSDKAVALVVKRCADAAGLDAARYSGHSLRAGLATSAAAAGVSERAIQNQTGHRSVTMLRRYIREGSLFRENAAASVGL